MKPILFIDFDGTLCRDRFWRSFEQNNSEKIQTAFRANKSKISDWMRGSYTSEEINNLISKETNIPFDNLWQVFVADCKSMRIDSEALNRIQNLRKYYHAILVTDNMDCFSRFTVPALNLDKYFDSIINSFNIKKRKDDNGGELFMQLANKFNSKIEYCILADDSKKTCGIFSKLGGESCLVRLEKPLSYWLEKIGNEKRN